MTCGQRIGPKRLSKLSDCTRGGSAAASWCGSGCAFGLGAMAAAAAGRDAGRGVGTAAGCAVSGLASLPPKPAQRANRLNVLSDCGAAERPAGCGAGFDSLEARLMAGAERGVLATDAVSAGGVSGSRGGLT